MMRLFDIGLVMSTLISSYPGGTSPKVFDVGHQKSKIEARMPLEAWKRCDGEGHNGQRSLAAAGRQRGGCKTSIEIVLRDRWSDCLERFASDNWRDVSQANGSGRRVAQRLFRQGLLHCQAQGDALRVCVGERIFKEERQYSRNSIVESYALKIEEERASEI